jgi:pentatricopeptide repeat protein
MKLRGIQRTVITYNAAITVCSDSGQYDAAWAVHDELLASSLKCDLTSYNTLITLCSRSSKPEKAQSIFNKMQQAGIQPDIISYNALIAAYGSSGLWQKAVDVFNELKSSELAYDAISYSAVITACAVGEQHDLAAALLREANAADHKLTMQHKRAPLQCDQAAA